MKKTYSAPVLQVDEAEMDGLLMAMSIQLSDESGSEEYVKGQNAAGGDGDWDIDW